MRNFLKNKRGKNRIIHRAINIQEWVICLWPNLCSIGTDKKGNNLPIADFGVSISGSKLAMLDEIKDAYVGSILKLVKMNSVNRIEKVICVGAVNLASFSSVCKSKTLKI